MNYSSTPSPPEYCCIHSKNLYRETREKIGSSQDFQVLPSKAMGSGPTFPPKTFILITKPEDINSTTTRSATASHARKHNSQQKNRRLFHARSAGFVEGLLTWRATSAPAPQQRPDHLKSYKLDQVSIYQQALAQLERELRDVSASLGITSSLQQCEYSLYYRSECGVVRFELEEKLPVSETLF